MAIKTTGDKVKPEVLVIPKIKSTSLKFLILYALAENGTLWAEDLANIAERSLSTIYSTVMSLRRDGLVYKRGRDISLTQAGEWYYREYEKLM